MSRSHELSLGLFPEPELSIAGLGRALRQRQISCRAILERCLRRIDRCESAVRAWVVLDTEAALEDARRRDSELEAGKDRGPLHGIPIGIKDLIDVAGLPTACGSKHWAQRIAKADAQVVANLRQAGAVFLGKTVTTPYACIDPPITRNPWNLERTPGGSSSGSAAAVASGMCLAALGTQTGGSITRPASFCGLAGMKPTYGLVSTHGLLPLSPSLDHVGAMARTVDDLRLVLSAARGEETTESSDRGRLPAEAGVPRLGRLRGFFDSRAEPAMRSAFHAALDALAARGAVIVPLDDPVDFPAILADHERVVAPEAARFHSDRLDALPDDYPPHIRELIEKGKTLLAIEHLKAKDHMQAARSAIQAALARGNLHALITPATIGPAPDPLTTGDAAFNAPWSFTHLPTVSCPIGLADDGLPLAVQFVGDLREDAGVLQTAEWCERAIRASRL